MREEGLTVTAKDCSWDTETDWAPVREGRDNATHVFSVQRDRCPVTRNVRDDGSAIWHAFRAEDVAAILGDPSVYSSAVPKFGAPLIPIEVDPPMHGVYRALLNKMMSPRRLVRYEAAVREAVVAALEPLVAAGGGDLGPLTYSLPIRAFCLLMGEEDAGFDALDQARRKGSPSPQRTDDEANATRAALMAPLREFCRKRLLACRTEPGDDLATDIALAEIDGAPLDEETALSILSLIYVAGHGTTTMGMQGALLCLGRHLEAQDRLRARPQAIPAALEECLRLETPIQTLPRYCIADTDLGGNAVRAGDQVYPVYGAANVDPDLFDNPERFDIDRKPHHFAFGRGIHMCAGAPLARMQMRVLVEELLKRTSSFSLREEPARKPWPHNGALKVEIQMVGRDAA